MAGEYAGDIYVYHRCLEEESHYLVHARFMERQVHITVSHRRVLVDWLAQVHFRYHLMQETMLLTIDILDRYLQVWQSAYLLMHSAYLLQFGPKNAYAQASVLNVCPQIVKCMPTNVTLGSIFNYDVNLSIPTVNCLKFI